MSAANTYTLIAQLLGSEENVSRLLSAKLQQTKGKSPRWFIRPEVERTTDLGPQCDAERIYCPDEIAAKGARARERWRQETLGALNRRDLVLPASMKFGKLLDEFERRHLPKISASTAGKYGSHVKNHIRPEFGDKALCEVTTGAMQDWIDAKAKTLSWSTRSDLVNLIRLIWEKADEWRVWQDRNPARHLDPGRKRMARERRLLTIDQTRQLLAALHPDVRLCCELALYGTLRISEVLGVQERHIDARAGTLRIEQRYYRGDPDLYYVPVRGSIRYRQHNRRTGYL